MLSFRRGSVWRSLSALLHAGILSLGRNDPLVTVLEQHPGHAPTGTGDSLPRTHFRLTSLLPVPSGMEALPAFIPESPCLYTCLRPDEEAPSFALRPLGLSPNSVIEALVTVCVRFLFRPFCGSVSAVSITVHDRGNFSLAATSLRKFSSAPQS